MKLYTEEQVHSAMLLALGKHGIYIPNKHYQDLIDLLTPIELPSNEEIGEFINTFPYTKQLDDGQFNDGVIYGATIGIDWMRDKIQGGTQKTKNYE